MKYSTTNTTSYINRERDEVKGIKCVEEEAKLPTFFRLEEAFININM